MSKFLHDDANTDAADDDDKSMTIPLHFLRTRAKNHMTETFWCLPSLTTNMPKMYFLLFRYC